MFIATLFNNSQKVETTQMSINKMWHTHAMEHYLNIKDKVLTYAMTSMNLENRTSFKVKEATEKGHRRPHLFYGMLRLERESRLVSA